MDFLRIVFVISLVLSGQQVSGFHTVDNNDNILSTEVKSVLESTVNEIIAKYDNVLHEIQAVVARQQEQIQSLQNDKAVLQEAVNILITEAKHHDQRLNQLTQTVAMQGKQIKDLEISNQDKSISIQHLEDKIKATESRPTCQCSKKATPENETSHQTNVSSIKPVEAETGNPGRARRVVENEVAFYAYITNNGYQTHLGVDQDIVFDHVVTNIGGGYLATHGTFVAPISGTYVFSATLHVPNDSRAYLVAAGNVMARFYGDTDENVQVSQTVVVQLQKGDDVSVRNMNLDHSYYGQKYTTFSGFLLYETFGTAPAVVGK